MSKVIVNGLVEHKRKTIHWEIFDKNVSFGANGQGNLWLSCPETVMEFDWKGSPVPTLWPPPDDTVRVEWDEDEKCPSVYCKRQGKWVLLLRLMPTDNTE